MKLTSLTVVINDEDYIYYAIKSIYDVVDQIIIVEGAAKPRFGPDAVKLGIITRQGLSGDRTGHEIEKLLAGDSEKKIKYIPYGWAETVNQLRQISLSHVLQDTDYCLITDADVVYKPKEINHLRNIVEKNPKIKMIACLYLMFFRSFDNILVVGDENLERCNYIYPNFFFRYTPEIYYQGQHPYIGEDQYVRLLRRITLDELNSNQDSYLFDKQGIFSAYHYGWARTQAKVEQHLLRWSQIILRKLSEGGGREGHWDYYLPLMGRSSEEILEYHRTYHKLWTNIFDAEVKEQLIPFQGTHPLVIHSHPYFGKSAEELGWQI